MSSTSVRVSEHLYREADAEGAILQRSAAKQVEFWANIGKCVADKLPSIKVMELLAGTATVQVESIHAKPVDVDAVFAQVREVSVSGLLGRQLNQGRLTYEASRSQKGMVDRIMPDGSRATGRFYNGEFIAL